MKKVKKLAAILLGASMVATCLVGCGGNATGDSNGGGSSETDIEIAYWNAGLGTDWLDAMIEEFEKEYPEYNVYYNASASDEAIMKTIGMEDVDTVDIYMGLRHFDNSVLEPLDDLLDTTAKGDSKKIGEKFDEKYLLFEKDADGHYYGLTYGGGALGLVYNKEMFDEAGISELPRTTDELAAVCDVLYNQDKAAHVHFNQKGYWEFLTEVWMAQYDGLDYYLNNLYACKDENGNSPSKEVFTKKDGRYEALLAYEKFITPEYVLAGSNSYDHVTAQTMFMNESAAMMANGSWLVNEMKEINANDQFEMMRLPVLSSIRDRLETVKSEVVLRKLITAIDSVTDGDKKLSDYEADGGYDIEGTIVSENDWEIVTEARNSIAINYTGDTCHIPAYSNAKEGAKKFLEFMYSDKGYVVYADTLHLALPMTMSEGELDTSKWNAFEKNQYKLLNTATNFISNVNGSKHKIYTDGGATPFCGQTYINHLCAKNPSDRLTADDIWEKMMQKVEDSYEGTWLANIK